LNQRIVARKFEETINEGSGQRDERDRTEEKCRKKHIVVEAECVERSTVKVGE